MKRFAITLIILLAICGSFFYALSWPRGLGDERAVGGVLDLTGADFSQTRHNLDGEWEFYFGALYTPEDFASGVVSDGTIINVPGSWHESGYPRHGFATYRLVIKADEPSLMLFLPQITSASVVWINGTRVFEAGTIATEPIEEHGARNAFVPFSPKNGQTEIIVQASNFTWFTSGMRSPLVAGTPENVLSDAIFRRVVLALFIGVLLAVFMYHISLFAQHRKEWVYLAFAIFSFLSAVQFTMETDGILHLFWGRTFFTRDLLQVVTITKGLALLVFTHLALKMPVGKARWIIYVFSAGVPLAAIIFMPHGTVDARIVFLAMLPMFVLFFSTLRTKVLKGNYYNLLFVIALGLFCIDQPINRIFFDERRLYMFLLVPNLFLILSQFLLLSKSHAKAKEAEQRLADENAALENLSRMKSNFFADMSHEMKSPLGVMDGYAQLAVWDIDAGTANANTKENLSKISKEARRLVSLVNGLLEISAESLPTGIIQVTVEDAINRAITLCEPILAQNNNKTAVKIEKNCPPVSANPETLLQVLMNLLTNANRQINSGTITITVASVNGMVLFEIEDGGNGIPPALLSRVFERGVSGDGSTGLGLHICKEAIEAHGGTIKLESPVPGTDNGTRASFTLPVCML